MLIMRLLSLHILLSGTHRMADLMQFIKHVQSLVANSSACSVSHMKLCLYHMSSVVCKFPL